MSLKNPKSEYTILVNSCDNFEDCWNPFFKLFATYWKGLNSPIILNTERKKYEFPGLMIDCSQVNLNIDRRLTWSECLISAINQINTPLVLYLQEDYFIEDPVDVQLIDEMSGMMLEDNTIKYIGLTRIGSYPPFLKYDKDSRLWAVSKRSRYRISLQAGLWRKEILLSYLRADENAWMFEIFGTIRSRKKNELFLALNRKSFNTKERPVIVYEHTGIIKGKWHPKIPALFDKHQIKVDFSRRGIYKEKPWLLRKYETVVTLAKNPVKFIKGMLGK